MVRLETSTGQRFKIARAPATVPRAAEHAYPMQATGNFYVTFLVDDIHERAGLIHLAVRFPRQRALFVCKRAGASPPGYFRLCTNLL